MWKIYAVLQIITNKISGTDINVWHMTQMKNNTVWKVKYHISVYFNGSQKTIHSLCNNSTNQTINNFQGYK